jgi:hypothetical protein
MCPELAPQQFHSGISQSSIDSALATARSDSAKSRDDPCSEQPGK